MKEIIERLHENRQIELAKEILESAGYRVEKNSLNESVESFNKVFKTFSKEDWYGYSGAQKLPDGSGPFISYTDEADIILSSDEDTIYLEIIPGDEDFSYGKAFDSIDRAKDIAVEVQSDLSKGKSALEIAREFNLTKIGM